MFPEMRRFKQQVSESDCQKILTEEKRAAFSVIGHDGYPYTIPINFYYDENDHRIYLHSAKAGHKMDALKNCDKVCLTTWNQGFKKDGDWEWNATSVVVFGKIKFVEDQRLISDRLRKMASKYYPNQAEVEAGMTSPAFNHVQMLAIEIEHMTGKLVNEK
ncbi:MAG: pyridoxamine 5'-phosphate oxidase family protein [Eubacteriaceae bacterium]